EFLSSHPKVTKVHYPGLADHPGNDVAAQQMSAFGGMVSFEVGSEAEAVDVAQRTKLFFLAESLGGVESLIEVPGPMTHASVAGCSLEVLIEEFSLGDDPALARLARIVHAADVVEDLATDRLGPGLLAIGEGGLAAEADDHELLRKGSFVYDALYEWCRTNPA